MRAVLKPLKVALLRFPATSRGHRQRIFGDLFFVGPHAWAQYQPAQKSGSKSKTKLGPINSST